MLVVNWTRLHTQAVLRWSYRKDPPGGWMWGRCMLPRTDQTPLPALHNNKLMELTMCCVMLGYTILLLMSKSEWIVHSQKYSIQNVELSAWSYSADKFCKYEFNSEFTTVYNTYKCICKNGLWNIQRRINQFQFLLRYSKKPQCIDKICKNNILVCYYSSILLR